MVTVVAGYGQVAGGTLTARSYMFDTIFKNQMINYIFKRSTSSTKVWYCAVRALPTCLCHT